MDGGEEEATPPALRPVAVGGSSSSGGDGGSGGGGDLDSGGVTGDSVPPAQLPQSMPPDGEADLGG